MITPFTLSLLVLPMWVLYEVSIFIKNKTNEELMRSKYIMKHIQKNSCIRLLVSYIIDWFHSIYLA